MSTTAFPLPAPCLEAFAGGGPGLSRKRLVKLARARVLHVLVMALNYLYLGRFPTTEEIGRRPNKIQCQIFDRVRSMIAVCGASRDQFPLCPGRSGPQLASSLMHLENFVQHCSEFSDPYKKVTSSKFYFEDEALLPVEDFPQLVPFRELDPSRLRLVGCGQWRMEDYLHDCLWLPFVEPRFLWHGLKVPRSALPCFKYEKKEANLQLAKVWDINGLLALFDSPATPGHFCRVFQVFKSAVQDRQIGDRRLPNAREFHIQGPSRHLPPGHLLCQLQVKRGTERLLGSVTDRRDFYHQALVTPSRARSNLLPFGFPLEDFKGTKAYDAYVSEKANVSRKKNRFDQGDELGGPKAVESRGGVVYPGFASLFQGDHLGVEFALSSHEHLLKEEGILQDSQRLQGHHRVPIGRQWTGLVIDDFFAIGAEETRKSKTDSFAYKALVAARLAYEKHELEGSPEKDVQASDHFKAAGAEIDSRPVAVRNGLCLVAAPFAKRFALSALTLRTASLPVVTPLLAARLSGNWTSALLFRRCLASVVEDFFSLSAGLEKEDAEKVVPLKRRCAEELVLLAVFAPLMSSNVAAKMSRKVFVTDASIQKGAIVSGFAKDDVVSALWHSTEKRGHYTMLDDPLRARLRKLLPDHENSEEIPVPEEVVYGGPFRPPLLVFDFVEICGGAGVISRFAAELGMTVAPVLDISESASYDLRDLRFLERVCHMISSGRFKSFMIEPPCTSFSAAAHPAVRSYAEPLGFVRDEKKTLHGNMLAFRSFVILKVGQRHKRPCGLEQPFLSKMRWLSFWQTLLGLGFQENFLASCQFGSVHKKEFCFLLFLFEDLTVRCPGGHQHVRVEGQWTKQSATYVDGLGLYLAEAFKRAVRRAALREEDQPTTEGFESVVCNDLLLGTPWKLEKVWEWKRKSHINVLESFVSVSALGQASEEEPDSRICLGVDSRVSKGALAKGRSSARSLQPMTRRSCAIQLAFGTFPAWFFSPTRLNPADAPTRDQELSTPGEAWICNNFDLESLADMHFVGLRRFAANWVRLFILIQLTSPACAVPVGSSNIGSVDHMWIFSGFALSDWVPWSSLALLAFGFCLWISLFGLLRRRQSSPGLSGLFIWTFSLCSIACSCPGRVVGFCVVSFACCPQVVSAMEPQSAAERLRAQHRRETLLPADRVVRKETRQKRMQLLNQFRTWLWRSHGVSLHSLMTEKVVDAERISHWLVAYGREMFASGKSYGRFSETINGIAMTRPLLKKQLTPAWDLCFAWLANEPHQHHPAMPASILLAMLTAALYWGWPYEAAVLALAWTGVCRIGEVLQAKREDLVLPQDAAPGISFVLLRIADPKTRGRSARHQSARVDQEDIVQLLVSVYGRCASSEPLWPLSAATLRSRFTKLLQELGLPTSSTGKARCFDLSSLRPGGATFILNMTENTELVRRRGRWLSQRVCDIYLQEVQVYGFYDECLRKYGNANSWKYCTEVFDYLTLTAIVENSIFCVHGGLSPDVKVLDQIRTINRVQEIPHEGAFGDIVWSDPEDIESWAASPRGAGWLFGERPTQHFNRLNGLDLIARAHQLVQEGYKYMFADPLSPDDKTGLLVTVWSAPNYCYRCGNVASILDIDERGEREFRIFQEVPASAAAVPPRQLVPYFL
eukprot:s1879_g20.t1